MTLTKNSENLTAGPSRNRGYDLTAETLPSEFIWMVDGDDYMADANVLQELFNFTR